jgi:hypothetical protein
MATNSVQELQDEFLSTIRKGQETWVEAIRTWVETVQSMTPSVPSMSVPSMEVPLTDKLPRPEEVVASAYDFTEKLLASQRQFAEEVLKAAVPLMPGLGTKQQEG